MPIMNYQLGASTNQSWIASSAKWLLTNLLYYMGGVILFAVGFLVFATVYAFLYPKSVPQPDAHPSQSSAPATVALPPVQTIPEKKGPIVSPQQTGPIAKWDDKTPVLSPQQTANISKLDDKSLLGKKLIDNSVFRGYIVKINRDEHGAIVSFGVSDAPTLEANAPVTEVKVINNRLIFPSN